MPAQTKMAKPNMAEYKDKEKPTQIRISNIEAAKGILELLFTIVTIMFLYHIN